MWLWMWKYRIRCNHLKRGAKVAGCYFCINVLSKNKEGLVAGAGVKKKSSLVEEWSVMVREEQRELGEKFSWTNKSLWITHELLTVDLRTHLKTHSKYFSCYHTWVWWVSNITTLILQRFQHFKWQRSEEERCYQYWLNLSWWCGLLVYCW